MPSIQHSFSFENLSIGTELENVQIVVVFPRFSFRILDEKIERFVSDHITFTVSHNPNDEEYGVKIPLSKIVGNNVNDIYGFFLYHFIEILNPENNINDFSIPFTVLVKDNKGNEINTETFDGIFYRVKSASSDYDYRNYKFEKDNFVSIYGDLDELNIKGLKQLPKVNEKLVYILNKEKLEMVRGLLNGMFPNHNLSHISILELIEILTDFSGSTPIMISKESEKWEFELKSYLDGKELRLANIKLDEIGEGIDPFYNLLFDFPLSISEIKQISIEGSLEIESKYALTHAHLDFYDLNIEYGQKNALPVILRYDWAHEENQLVDNKIDFSFTKDGQIVANNISGLITVRLKGYDGAVLWQKRYSPSDPKLEDIQIKINAYPAGEITTDSSTGKPKSTKRLRGKVLQHGTTHELNDLTIIIRANTELDENFKIVSAGQTDKSGNFSLDYPFGSYKQARAFVSLMPNDPAIVEIVNKPNETISDDFIYLLISDEAVVSPIEDNEGDKHDDCDCSTPNKAKRLPDQADLIDSDEYTQDIGGSCINLSTPNRTLKEYSYNAIVRVSDPDVSNYVLKKEEIAGKVEYKLVGGDEKLERGVVDLDNPIRWEDAPDAKDNLSLYQAVTVATGHILHFKSVFKADGYSLGDLVYSLPLAPGQKKQIVVFESSHTLQGAESQSISQGESLTAGLISDRYITDQLGGGIHESLRGRSRAHTSGMSAGLGAAGSYGGIGASLGIAGGFSNSNSSASQNGSRNVSQFFDEKLRQTLMQNAESYRELNASVVTTVTEGQDYGVTAETIANHNHCHSLTMMYFEVLRHFAIYQEVSHVEECIFVPLLLTSFTTENIHKWKDILAVNLLPIPSNTYLTRSFYREHPLLKAFDANERVKTDWARVGFPPKGQTFADGDIKQIRGSFTMNVNMPRPKTKYDRIKSFPVYTEKIISGETVEAAVKRNALAGVAAAFIGPFAGLFMGGQEQQVVEVQLAQKISDAFMTMDDNFRTVSPANCIRIKTFSTQDVTLFGITVAIDVYKFFEDGHIDELLWTSYARILGYNGTEAAADMMNYYFAGRLIAEWDAIFYNDILPLVFSRIADSIKLSKGRVKVVKIEEVGNLDRFELEFSDNGPDLDISTNTKYTGGNKTIRVNFSGYHSGTRRDLSSNGDYLAVVCTNEDAYKLRNHLKLNIGSVNIDYSTAYFQGTIFRGYVNDDLLDGTNLYIPLNSNDKKSPHKEDEYVVSKLIEHLNSNLEHYNKVLWTNLDPDRRYMLLDGFTIQTYTSKGRKSAMRSLASVVKNELINIAGNSLVLPVADGYKVGRNSMLEEVGDNEFVETPLLDYYKPLTPMPPYRLSVPTRGVFMEAIQGNCDACEMVKENSSQDWDKFRTEETTSIQPIVTPTPTITNYSPEYKDFAQPLVNIQNAPDAPAPAAGLSGLNELLGKSDAFRDITGLAGNQSNVIETFKANTKAAQEYAKMASSLAKQQHNTQNSPSITDGIGQARRDGNISEGDARDLTRQHLQHQIDGGESDRDASQFEREQNRTSLSDVAADAVNRGQSVQAERTDSDGTREQISVEENNNNNLNHQLVGPPYDVTPIRQVRNSCWATVATMMYNWKNGENNDVIEVLREIGNRLVPPDENRYVSIYENIEDNGLPIEEVDGLIDVLGLVAESHASFTPESYKNLLTTYGPLWINIDSDSSTNFSPHAKILINITGDVKGDPSEVNLSFVDPAIGRIANESFTDFIRGYEQLVLDADSSADLISQIIHFREVLIDNQPVLGTGGSSSLLSINLRNVHIPSLGHRLGNVGEARIEIKDIDLAEGDEPNLVVQTSANGRGNINIDGLSEGTYFLNVIPNHAFDYSLENLRNNVSDDIDKIYESNIRNIQIVISVNQSGLRSVSIPEEIRNESVRIGQNSFRNVVEIDEMNLIIRLQPLWLRSNNIGTAPYGRSREIRNLVIHHTGNSEANRSINTFIGGNVTSIHYLMDINGRLIKMVNENEIANHAGNSYWNGTFRLNDGCLGIEICNGNGENYAPEQIDALVFLLRTIVDDGTLSPDSIRNIIGHSDIATSEFSRRAEPNYDNRNISIESSRRIQDPGPLFDWKRLEAENLTFSTQRDSANDVFYLKIFNHINNLKLRDGDNDSISRYGGRVRTLDPEISNDVIQLIQNDLKAIGYLVNTDGHFTEKTEEAIKVFRIRAFSNTNRTLLPNDINPNSGSVSGRIDFETAKKIRDYSPLSNPTVT